MKRMLALLAVSSILLGSSPQDPRRPNFVFILIDDLRWDAVGCMGHPFVKTPNIDRIAKEGALFKNFFVTTPLCSPSRASFLTGRYVRAHGVKGNGNNNALSHKLVTFPRLLHDAGYETAYMGKWHMGNDDSPRPGIDRWVSFKGQGVYPNPAFNIDGKEEKAQGYMTDLLNDHAVEFLRKPHAKPFVLYLAHKAVHGPFTPADRHKGLYSDQKLKVPASAEDTLEGKPALRRKDGAAPPKGKGGGHERIALEQLRQMAAVDEGVGKMFKVLEESKQLDHTVFAFSSDNGYFWGEHGLGDKRAAYEESIRDPLLVRYPPLVKPGIKIDQLALNVDIAPTFLDLAGASIPKDAHGRSLVPLLKGETAGWRASFLCEYFAEPNFPRIPTWEAVRTERWKYIHYTDHEGMDELYDLQADPVELKNLINDPAAAAALKAAKEELERLAKDLK